MKTNRLLDLFLSLFAVLLAYALSYGLSLWREAARLSLVNTWRPVLFIIQMIAILIIMATSLMALNWFINSKIRPHAAVSWIIFLGGCLLLLFPLVLEFSIPIRFIRDQWFRMTLLYVTCAFITVIGGIGIITKRKT